LIFINIQIFMVWFWTQPFDYQGCPKYPRT
jgi:hypothetical protein